MRRLVFMLFGLCLAAAAPPLSRADQTLQAQDRTRADMIQAIEQRFWGRIVEDLGLDGQQAQRLRATVREYASRRRDLERRERELKQALARQLRPGIAADQARVAELTDALLTLKVEYAQSFRDEHRAVGAFLDPVQQAQLLAVRERLMQRIRQIQQQRQRQQRGTDRIDRDPLNP